MSESSIPEFCRYIRVQRTKRTFPPLSDDLRELRVDFELAESKISEILGTYGVVVVTGVLSDDECNHHMEQIVGTVTRLSDEVSYSDLSTWKPERLMPQIQPGVFACGIGNSKAVWQVRVDPRVKHVYSLVYGTSELVSSVDMINVKPPIAPYHDPSKKDWAHTDSPSEFEKCIQGQIVLSNTSAGFVCSPRSHLISAALVGFIRKHSINEDFEARQHARKLVESVGGKFQVPCIVPRGSIIIWLSSVLHSAKLMDEPSTPIISEPSDPWLGWRCVVYLAYRPKAGIDATHLESLKIAFEKNRTTRHTGELFHVRDISKYTDCEYTKIICEYYQQMVIEGIFPIPELTPELTPEIMDALGMTDC